MPPKMAEAATADIDQRIATAATAALAARAPPAPVPAAVNTVGVKLAELADKLWDARNSQSVSTSRRNDESWCRNHRRLGDKTRNCIPPCSYSAEN